MRHGMTAVVLAAVLALAVGCVTVGTRVDPGLADRLTVGVSTRADAVALLGQPTTVTDDAAVTVLAWSYAHGNALGHAQSAAIALTFDARGILIDKTRSQTDLH